jgi:hypothetical protein
MEGLAGVAIGLSISAFAPSADAAQVCIYALNI